MRRLPELEAFAREIGLATSWQRYGRPDFCAPELGLTNAQIGMLSSGLALAWVLDGATRSRAARRLARRR